MAVVIIAASLLIVLPAINRRLVQGQLTGTLSNARQLQIAAQMMSLDRANNGETRRGGLPADLGVKSKKEYLARLTRENYLSAADAAKFATNLALVNVASDDPPDTAFVVPGWMLHPERPHDTHFAFTIGGSGGASHRKSDATNPEVVKLPNRQPQILPDE